MDVAVHLPTTVYLQHRNAGGLPALVSVLASIDSTTISQQSSSEEQCYHISLSVYTSNTAADHSNLEANSTSYSALSP